VETTSLGLIECSSLARGSLVCDAMLKTARVHLLLASAVTPGKLLVGIEGAVAEVEAAMERGIEVCGPTLEDALFLPRVHAQLAQGLEKNLPKGQVAALGVVETATVSAGLRAADASLKAAAVRLLSIRLAAGIGGKAVYYLEGEVADVEAAVSAGSAAVRIPEFLVATAILPRPHPDYAKYLDGGAGRQPLPPGVIPAAPKEAR
jgi:microcompartment protein CcmL/EutN